MIELNDLMKEIVFLNRILLTESVDKALKRRVKVILNEKITEIIERNEKRSNN